MPIEGARQDSTTINGVYELSKRDTGEGMNKRKIWREIADQGNEGWHHTQRGKVF